MAATLDDHQVPEQQTAAAIDDEFLDLMCSDEAWLRAEFNAIVAAERADPPQRSPHHWPLRRKTPRNQLPGRAQRPQNPPLARHPRERSPPRDQRRRPRQRSGRSRAH
jgi:hypothetical protein